MRVINSDSNSPLNPMICHDVFQKKKVPWIERPIWGYPHFPSIIKPPVKKTSIPLSIDIIHCLSTIHWLSVLLSLVSLNIYQYIIVNHLGLLASHPEESPQRLLLKALAAPCHVLAVLALSALASPWTTKWLTPWQYHAAMTGAGRTWYTAVFLKNMVDIHVNKCS